MSGRRSALLAAAVGSVVAACAQGGGLVFPVRPKVEFTPVPELEARGAPNPHDFKGTPLCQRCHVAGEVRPSVDPISLCAECHDLTFMKHPFGVEQPGGAGTLPLMPGNEIGCHTCHDPHDVKKNRHGIRDEYSKLCLACHKSH